MNPKTKFEIKSPLLMAMIGGLLSVGLSHSVRADDAATSPSGTPSATPGATADCWGVNKCKGVGSCGSPEGAGCAGTNECRRKGFLTMDKELCLKLDGASLKPIPASKKKAGKKTS